MKKIIIILLIVVSCDWSYYIKDNPNHPREYLGIWTNINTTLEGVRSDSVLHWNFEIDQDAVWLTIPGVNHKYPNWKVEKGIDPPWLVLYGRDTLIYEILWKPKWNDLVLMTTMTLANGNIIYYLKKQ